ncbi:hypothetical protein [Mastigocoleus testarum]|uniref:Uncharacterized protein n=1 Tax=Mastigocoleus testarum BC008 TaxID=371196 RepID=A0A0V7ZWY8_9CYAN|nr:hypothetical protein [Mastigocoleus testarum]KST62504.1 hypothetical protein BC008_10055 [Mastigocoleus testarum BC008]KST69124.1 hypothetical protein BC008_35010 [Mastigocoleus testarum BC008]
MQKTSALTRTILFGTGLTSLFLGLNSSIVSAQVTPFTIQSTGTLSGTLELPAFNPNFNRVTTRVDTDHNGTYFRHGKAVYSSDYVKMKTGTDGSLQYYVDFKGIPVISKNGAIASPVLSGGELQDYKYQGKIDGTKFQAVVQDEFGIKAGFYKGIVTDPKTGKQYEGTFKVTGQGPRYSDPNGGESPTVFDFKSDLPGKPTVTSLEMKNSPLVKLYVEVPADAVPITTTGGSSTTGGGSSSNTNTGGGSTTGVSSTTSGSSSSNTSGSSANHGSSNTGASGNSVTNGNLTNNNSNSIGTDNQIIPPSPINTANNNINSFDSLLPSTIPDIEFSSGNYSKLNPKVGSLSKEREVTIRKKLIGPRSRVLLR